MSLPFLAHLGLHDEADERDIKRAYARLLKQIDQATDAAGFQALREAYEAALHWHRHRDPGVPRHIDPTPPASEPPEALPATQADSPIDPPPPAPEPRPSGPRTAPDPAPAPVQPHAEVFDVFLQFMGRLTTHGDKPSMREALAACLDDPRAQSLDARDMLEWFIAKALADGWKPGHDVLMATAIDFFEWTADRHRLLRFGRVGQMIDESIAERMVFENQSPEIQERLKAVLRLLRRPPRDDDAGKAELHRAELDMLLQHFPNWLWVNAPADRVQQWRQWANNPVERSALLANAGTAPATPAPAPRPAPSPTASRPAMATPPTTAQPAARQASRAAGRKAAMVWFVLGIAVGMATLFGILEVRHMANGSTSLTTTNTDPANDPLNAVKAAYRPQRLDPPGYGPPQRPPPYPPPRLFPLPPPAQVKPSGTP